MFIIFPCLLLSVGARDILSEPPVIDLTALFEVNKTTKHNEEVKRVKEAIGQACGTWGFFQVVNHGISLQTIEDMHTTMLKFFDLPEAAKKSIKVSRNNSRGYNGKELTKQKVDMKEIFDVGHKPYPDLPDNHPQNTVVDGFNQWPDSETLPHFRPAVENFYTQCNLLARLLMSVIAEDFNMPASFFEEPFNFHTSFLRLNYYPLQNSSVSSSSALGVSRHTDAGGLTLLMQDYEGVSGLEVYSGSKEDAGDGEWVPVLPVPGSLTINTGDMLQVWSNDIYKAPEHRVRPSVRQKRYSAPFFYNPNYASIIEPIPVSAPPLRYRPISWQTFRQNRFLGDYENRGVETQIDDFKNEMVEVEAQIE